jgi:hypothetical protein
MKVCLNSSGAYDFGKNTEMFRDEDPSKKQTVGGFGVRFFFNKNLLKNN